MHAPIKILSLALLLALSFTSAALAGDGGLGLYGETNDKVITFFGLGLIVLFPLITVIGSVTQAKLERRKQQRAATLARSRSTQR